MSRVFSVIVFIILLVLLLIVVRQCTPAPKISKQDYHPKSSVVSEGIIRRTTVTPKQPSSATIKQTTVVADNTLPLKSEPTNQVDEKKTTTTEPIKKPLSPSEAIANAAKQAQENAASSVKSSSYIILQGVNFEFGSATLDSKATARLDRIIKRLKAKPELTIEIAGYADSTENKGLNKNISQLRSEAVKDYILSYGIQASRLIAKGYSSNTPIADNATPEGRKQNRRVEIHVKLGS